MRKPRLLDLFCGAGGAAMGYSRAGFDVVGVDINPQPHYPFTFEQGDAVRMIEHNLPWARSFDVVHASPPCQFGTAYRRRPDHVKESPNLISTTRQLLERIGRPFVIENLWLNRSHLHDPVKLCGSSFGLDVQRHRAFEVTVPLLPPPCDHSWQSPRFPQATNRTNQRRTVEVGVWRIPLADQQRAMGIDWMDLEELSEAIPPAYTNFLGNVLIWEV